MSCQVMSGQRKRFSAFSQRSNKVDNPIFIFGCPRSGTSLLSRILNAHPNIAIPFESHLYEHLYAMVEGYGDLHIPRRRERLVNDILRMEDMKEWVPPLSAEQALAAIHRYDFHGIFDGILQAWALSQGKTRWGEKTPQHMFYWRDILQGFPNLRVIHLVRDGRDVALSYREAFFGPKHIYPIALRWVKYLNAAEEVGDCLGRRAFLQVYYEDLLSDPQQEIRRICDFLGEEFTPQMLSFHNSGLPYPTDQRNAENLRKPILTENTNKWRKHMTTRDLRIFEAVAGSFLEQYGYLRALKDPCISRVERAIFQYLEHPPVKVLAMVRNRKSQKIALQRLKIYLRLRLGL